jgi:hypothetical protein
MQVNFVAIDMFIKQKEGHKFTNTNFLTRQNHFHFKAAFIRKPLKRLSTRGGLSS